MMSVPCPVCDGNHSGMCPLARRRQLEDEVTNKLGQLDSAGRAKEFLALRQAGWDRSRAYAMMQERARSDDEERAALTYWVLCVEYGLDEQKAMGAQGVAT